MIPNESHIREYEERKTLKKEVVLKQKEALSQRDLLIKICDTSFNTKWPDGRIYSHTEDGENISHSVSPHSKTFLNNIEDKIKPLIISLMQKNYFTMSSCQGHDLHDRRFIMLVFPSKETALEFKNTIPFKFKYNISNVVNVLNMNLDVDKFGNINQIEKQSKINNQHESAMEYINCLIQRNYADAWLLELIISDVIPDIKNPLDFFKYWKQLFFKVFLNNYYTKKLTRFIESNAMPFNIY